MTRIQPTETVAAASAAANAAAAELGKKLVARFEELRSKYPHHEILAVTRWSLNGPAAVSLRCTGCGEEHVRNVQDLFQVTVCPDCKDAERKGARKAKRGRKIASLQATIDRLNAELKAARTKQD